MEYERRTMRMTDETLRVNHSFAGRYRPRKYGCYRHKNDGLKPWITIEGKLSRAQPVSVSAAKAKIA